MRVVARQSVGPFSALALLAIRLYQRWISPIKGFRCAHAVLHGGPGCSGYAAQAIRSKGLIGALRAIRQRFRDCGAAFETLKSEQPGEDESADRKPGAKASFLGNACPSGCAACDLSAATGGSACSVCNLGAISCCN